MSHGELTLQTVAPELTERVWRDGAHVLGDAVPHEECTPDQLKYRLTHGELRLLVAVDKDNRVHGYAALAVHQLPNIRVLHIEAVHAPGCPKRVIDQLTLYARAHGCTALQGCGSRAVTRLWRQTLGFTERYTIHRKEI